MAETTGWGILATGKIASSFARNLRAVPGARLAAVGSRTAGSAEAFAEEYGGPDCRAHASYEALVADPDVDVVYIATPHALHLDNARLALEAGKHVLCEKPLTLNTAEAEEMVRLAGEHDRFLMEAMWMATHPVIRGGARRPRRRAGSARRAWCTPRSASSSSRPPTDRLLDPDLGGGALLDMGVYPLTFADLVLGPADRAARRPPCLTDAGIDLDIAIAGRHAGGAVAALTATMSSYSRVTATISTDTGRVDLRSRLLQPARRDLDPARRRAGADPRRRAAARQRARQRGGRGAALHRRGAAGEPAGAARADAADPAPDGRPAPPGRPRLPGRADRSH